jgi:hypothetical protein
MRIIFTLFILLGSMLSAQVKTLPYKNQFTSNADRAAFKSVRTGDTMNYNWSYYYDTSVSYAYHDYPVGGDPADTLSDWLFSPPIRVTSGAVLSFKYVAYAIMGSATPSDEFSVWYGKNKMDPKNGTFVKVADLTNKASSEFGAWKDTSGILLPFTADSGYIAFRYKATTNWFTINVDSVVVKIPGLSVQAISFSEQVRLLPNPAREQLIISSPVTIESIEVISMDGRIIHASPGQAGNIYIADWPDGTYIIKIVTQSGLIYKTFIKG